MKTALPALLPSAFFLTACITFEGIGKDIQRGGEKVEEAAKKK